MELKYPSQLQKGDIILLTTTKCNHYAVITEINTDTIKLHNPSETIGSNEFTNIYTGYSLTKRANQGRILNHDELKTLKGNKKYQKELWKALKKVGDTVYNQVQKW
jgi:hypothetical protein